MFLCFVSALSLERKMTYPRSTPLDSTPHPLPSQTQIKDPVKKTSSKKASTTKVPTNKLSAKKASAKKAHTVTACTITLPLTKEAYSHLIGKEQELVIFKDESNSLRVNLEEGND